MPPVYLLLCKVSEMSQRTKPGPDFKSLQSNEAGIYANNPGMVG